MASLAWDGDSARIQFMAGGKRVGVRLGVVSERVAGRVKDHIEAIADGKRFAVPVDNATVAWLAGIDDVLHGRLSAVGLVEPRRRAALAPFIDDYIAGRRDVRPNTLRNMLTASRRLAGHFGAGAALESIGDGAALEYRDKLAKKYARATVGREIKMCRQFFGAAVGAGYIGANPFATVTAWPCVNSDRTVFIDRPTIDRVMSATDSPRWHAIIALSRYGGLRCPSEVGELRWADVDFKRGRLTIRAHKTGSRGVPLFPEVRDVLMRLDRSGEYVIDRPRGVRSTFNDRFKRLIERAGLKPWPRLFHNLRASRETELASDYAIATVCQWMGNSALIAQRHYLTVREEDYARAVQIPAQHCQGNAALGRTG